MGHKVKSSFLRNFVGGFALGAALLVGVQVTKAGPEAIVPAAQAATR